MTGAKRHRSGTPSVETTIRAPELQTSIAGISKRNWIVALGVWFALFCKPTGTALAEEFRLTARVAVAIEGGPIVIRVELSYHGEHTINYLDIGFSDVLPFLVRPLDTGHSLAGRTLPSVSRMSGAWPTPLYSNKSLVTYVPLQRYQDLLKAGQRQLVIDWPVYALHDEDPTAGNVQIAPRVRFDVVTREDGVRDLSFRPRASSTLRPLKRDDDAHNAFESDRFKPHRCAMLREVLSIEVQPRSHGAIQSLYKQLVSHFAPRGPLATDDGFLDAVLSYNNEPTFDGLRARLLSYEAYSRASPFLQQILQNCTTDVKQLDLVFANFDVNSIHAVAAVLGTESLPPYFGAVFTAKMVGATSCWTRAMFLARYPKHCPAEWRENLLAQLSECDRPLKAAEIAKAVAALDDAQYRIRQQAKFELHTLGRRAIPAMRETLLTGALSAEQSTTMQNLVDECERRYPLYQSRGATYPGLFEYGRHAFVGVRVPETLLPARRALDVICSDRQSSGAADVLRALAKNGPESQVAVEAEYLLEQYMRKK